MKRERGLDVLKTICCFMIVCIHVPFPGLIGTIITPISRIAVPIFFMITGYFHSQTREHNKQTAQIIKILKLFVVSNMLYFLWSLLLAFVKHESLMRTISQMLSLESILRFVFLNESSVGYHLWYLGALLYVLVIACLWEKRWDLDKLYPLIPILLVVDLLFGKYSLLVFGRSFSTGLVRNFLFVGLPYFLIGDLLSKRKLTLPSGTLAIFSCVFVVTTLIERFALGYANLNGSRDHYVSTTFLAICVLLLTINQKDIHSKAIAYIGEKLSLMIYILHPILIPVLAMVVKRDSLGMVFECCRPFIIFLVATACAWLLHRINPAKKKFHSPGE